MRLPKEIKTRLFADDSNVFVTEISPVKYKPNQIAVLF